MAVDTRTLRWTRYTGYALNAAIVILSCVTMAMGAKIWRTIPGYLTRVNPNLDPTGEAASAAIHTLFRRGIGMIHDVANILIAAGIFAFVGGLFGIYATYRDSRRMLLAYWTLFSIIIILEISAGVAAWANAPKIGPSLTQAFRYSLPSYGYQETTVDSEGRVSIVPHSGSTHNTGSVMTTAIVNHVQTTIGCCGYDHHGYTDLRNSPYWRLSKEPPIFCCKFRDREQLILEDPSCAVQRTVENSHRNYGCVDAICDWIDFSFGPTMGVAIGIGLFDVFGIIAAGYQYYLLGREYKEFE